MISKSLNHCWRSLFFRHRSLNFLSFNRFFVSILCLIMLISWSLNYWSRSLNFCNHLLNFFFFNWLFIFFSRFNHVDLEIIVSLLWFVEFSLTFIVFSLFNNHCSLNFNRFCFYQTSFRIQSSMKVCVRVLHHASSSCVQV